MHTGSMSFTLLHIHCIFVNLCKHSYICILQKNIVHLLMPGKLFLFINHVHIVDWSCL